MRKLVVSVLAIAVVLSCGTALASQTCATTSPYHPKVWDDLSWWGNTGAKPDPVKDAVRSGYWWWPTAAASEGAAVPGQTCSIRSPYLPKGWDGQDGNRGVVYAQWTPKPDEKLPPEPPKNDQAKIQRDIPIFAHVLFDFDKSVLKPEGKAETDKVVGHMKQYTKDTLLIEGHTCDIGAEEYNMGLGQRRADSVKKYMVENGVEDARVTAQSFGETQPAVANDSAANRKLNRRAVFKITVVD